MLRIRQLTLAYAGAPHCFQPIDDSRAAYVDALATLARYARSHENERSLCYILAYDCQRAESAHKRGSARWLALHAFPRETILGRAPT